MFVIVRIKLSVMSEILTWNDLYRRTATGTDVLNTPGSRSHWLLPYQMLIDFAIAEPQASYQAVKTRREISSNLKSCISFMLVPEP